MHQVSVSLRLIMPYHEKMTQVKSSVIQSKSHCIFKTLWPIPVAEICSNLSTDKQWNRKLETSKSQCLDNMDSALSKANTGHHDQTVSSTICKVKNLLDTKSGSLKRSQSFINTKGKRNDAQLQEQFLSLHLFELSSWNSNAKLGNFTKGPLTVQTFYPCFQLPRSWQTYQEYRPSLCNLLFASLLSANHWFYIRLLEQKSLHFPIFLQPARMN